MWIRAKSYGIEVVEIEDSEEDHYKGYKQIVLDLSKEEDEQLLADFYEDKSKNVFNLIQNQYLILKDKEKTIDKFKWNGKEHVLVKLPKIKDLKPKNDLQAFAMDLLFDTDVPIKIIAGTWGSGKTFLTVKSAIWHIKEKGNYSTVMVVRNPVGSGKEIGFLPGDKEEKTASFFLPFIQHLEGKEFEAQQMQQRGQLEKEVPYFIKGRSIGSTFLYVDEAEDLTLRDIKTIGSRIEETSCVCFTGDYKQAERGYEYNNGLLQAIEQLKGNPLVGIVVLEEDVRSTASKVFADL
jgi:predicted ribonuclease YlaK